MHWHGKVYEKKKNPSKANQVNGASAEQNFKDV